MPMTRQERVALHTNQKRMQLSGDMPNEKSLVEGKPQYRETFKGLYQYVKYNNEVYSQLLTKNTRTLQEEINDTVNNITINDLTVTDPIDVDMGGTGLTSLSDGYVLLGNGTSSINLLDVRTSGTIIIGDGTTAPTTYDAFSSSTGTLKVSAGGTGASSLTDHSVLVGSGTNAVTPLTVGTNGQILVGSAGADPVFATLTCDDGLTSSVGAGTLEIDLDLKSAGGLAIESNELALSLGDASITGTLAVSDGGTGQTTVTNFKNVLDDETWTFANNVTATGRVIVDDTTQATSTTDGSLQTDGGLSVAKKAYIGSDATIAGGDIEIGATAVSGSIVVANSAASTAGNLFTIGGSDVTAGGGGTANVQGGSVIIKAGTSTGTATSGSIVFQTAPAGGASGTSASNSSLATVLTIAGDASSTFTGAIIGTTIDADTDFTVGTTVITDDSIVMTPSTSDTITIAGATNGALSIVTVDNAAAAANIQITADGTAELAGTTVTLDSSGDITLSAAGYQINMNDASTTRYTFNVDATPELDVTGAFIIDGSSTITLDAAGEFDVITNGRPAFKIDTSAHAYLHNPADVETDGTTRYNDYSITTKTGNYMLTLGLSDYQQNYSCLGKHFESSAYNTAYGT